MRDFERPGRSEAYGTHAMLATSHPLATLAAANVLREGGNAVDAVVCVVALLGVVEPAQTGIGGDCFALLTRGGSGDVIALNGSGWPPAAAHLDWYIEQKITAIHPKSAHAVTIPGAVAAWARLAAGWQREGLSYYSTVGVQVLYFVEGIRMRSPGASGRCTRSFRQCSLAESARSCHSG